MTIRLECPCGQLSDVPDSAGGKLARCPRCQAVIQVPIPMATLAETSTPKPAPKAKQPTTKPLVDPFAELQTLPSNRWASDDSQRQRTTMAQSRSEDRGSTWITTAVVSSFALTLVGCGGVAVWLILSFFSGNRIEDNFSPLESLAGNSASINSNPPPAQAQSDATNASSVVNTPKGRSNTETSMLAVADEFVRHARQNERGKAIALIDKDLFHVRLYGPKGSYEAMKNDIPSAKLLSNFGSYALDGAPIGGRRHWQIIGTSQFEDCPGVVVRYYVEPESPFDVLTDPKVFDRFGVLVPYDQLSQKASNLFTNAGQNTSLVDQYRTSTHPIHQAFPQRAGYMMLVFNNQESTPRLVDLVNVLGQSPLSRTGSHVFLADYRMLGGFGSRETHGTKPSQISIFGVSNLASGLNWDSNDPGAKERAEKKQADENAIESRKRPLRLERLVELWERGDAQLDQELKSFRSDFRNDLGFELAIVLTKMGAKQPKFDASDEKYIVAASQALYQQWRDPFFLYVEGLCAQANGRPADAENLFSKCKAAGFITTDYYMSKIRPAVDRGDATAIVSTLEEWNTFAATDGLTPNTETLKKLSNQYAQLDRKLNPEPSMGERMSAGRRGPFGGREHQLGMPSSNDSQSTSQFPPTMPSFAGTGRSSIPGPPSSQRGNPGQPPGFPFGPPTPPEISGPQVTIKITSSSRFDGNEIAKELAKKIGTQNYRFSQSNQTATLNMSFEGPLKTVVEAIDFGKVSSTDESTRTISVTLP